MLWCSVSNRWLVDADLDTAEHVAAFLLVVGLDLDDPDILSPVEGTP
jgi:hypothetical protein